MNFAAFADCETIQLAQILNSLAFKPMRTSKISLLLSFLFPLVGIAADEKKGIGAIEDEVSYTNDIAPIVKNFCTTCHAGDDPEGDLQLTTYEQVREATEKGDLLHRITDADDPMPEDGLMPLQYRRTIRQWAEKGYRNKGTASAATPRENYQDYKPPVIRPVDVSRQGFSFLEKMQGHWVGSMKLLGTDYDWMAFDYRAVSPSHVHGIYEGGTIGNLFTSFFVADFKGTKTLMARNGGILNGIYRTSYFVLEEVKESRRKSSYHFVDAYGGDDIMYMDIVFSGDSIDFKAYTSRFGLKAPKLHMDFKGKRKRPELAAAAAKAVGFPKNEVAFQFPNPMPRPEWTKEYPMTSASYIWEEKGKDLLELAKASKDPITIEQIPHLAKLTVSVERNEKTKGKNLHLYLSQKALTDESGKLIRRGRYARMDLLDTLLSFPELGAKSEEFTFTYLHPGKYYVTVLADMDEDWYPTVGDITHPLISIEVKPKSHETIRVTGLNVVN